MNGVLISLGCLLLLGAAIAGCGSGGQKHNGGGALSPEHPEGRLSDKPMTLTSTAFTGGSRIPQEHTGDGQDVSPPLAWTGAPESTREFALICDDPDAPSAKNPRPAGPWVHWVIYKIPAGTDKLDAAIPPAADHAGLRQGKNDFGKTGYGGPGPPKGSGPHRYFFRLFALDAEVKLDVAEPTKQQLLDAIRPHVIAEGQLIGVYERK